jgi:organic hydroperoxide reductase OsmC/OhrA
MTDSKAGHRASVLWQRDGHAFVDNRYGRAHAWSFDGGAEVRASASPANVPRGTADASAVDPEEGFVAAVASCHMLWFLSIAASRGFVVDRYEDTAVGYIMPLPGAPGREVLGRLVLRPAVTFATGSACSDADLAELHQEAHRHCFLANALGPACSLALESRRAPEDGPEPSAP